MTITPTIEDRGRAVLYEPIPGAEPHEGVCLGVAHVDRRGRITHVNVRFGRGCQPVDAKRLDWAGPSHSTEGENAK